jgi:hypothetical protein
MWHGKNLWDFLEIHHNHTIHVVDFKLFIGKNVLKDFSRAWGDVQSPFLCQTFGKSTHPNEFALLYFIGGKSCVINKCKGFEFLSWFLCKGYVAWFMHLHLCLLGWTCYLSIWWMVELSYDFMRWEDYQGVCHLVMT